MPVIRISLVTHLRPGETIEATKLPPIEFHIQTQHLIPFMQSLERLTATPDLLITAIIAMDTAVNLTRQETEHP